MHAGGAFDREECAAGALCLASIRACTSGRQPVNTSGPFSGREWALGVQRSSEGWLRKAARGSPPRRKVRSD